MTEDDLEVVIDAEALEGSGYAFLYGILMDAEDRMFDEGLVIEQNMDTLRSLRELRKAAGNGFNRLTLTLEQTDG